MYSAISQFKVSKSQGSTFLFMPVVDHLGKKVVLLAVGHAKVRL
jgi:hypothetical protein